MLSNARGDKQLLCKGTLARRRFQASFGCPIKSLGKVDILVNNADIIFYEPVIEVSEDEFDKIVAVNVNDTFFACQEAIRPTSEVGCIINFSSTTTS
jgi:3-oxoacyl-[acyl-carrier protein] reductase